MNRRHVLRGTLVLLVAVFTGCSRSSDVPATVASDAGLMASGLTGAFKDISAVPDAVVVSLTGLANAAQALADADTIASAQPIVQRIEIDVDVVVAAISALSLPVDVTLAIRAAQVLLTVIEAGVHIVVATNTASGMMTPEQARLVLAAVAAR